MDLSNLTPHQRILVNSGLVAGIAMFSIFATQEPSLNMLYSGLVAGILTFMVQLKSFINPNDDEVTQKQRPKLLSLV